MSTSTDPSTLPKPFVFVLMPFDTAFHDIYKFGIKGAADDVGAYAERLDEQVFMEGILERIFNQISKADVVIADMTGRNPNVFYEVGYAHALGKIVLLLTQDADDIPFDLKHRQHIVYDGKIDTLRKELVPKLKWAIAESKRREMVGLQERFTVRILGKEIKSGISSENPVEINGTVTAKSFQLPIMLRNDSAETLSEITHIYLFTFKDAVIVPGRSTPNFSYPFESGISYGTSSPSSSSKACHSAALSTVSRQLRSTHLMD